MKIFSTEQTMRFLPLLLMLCTTATLARADATLDAKVLKIFDDSCADCHSPTKHKNDKVKKPALDGTIDLAELRKNTKAVHPGDPDSSKLYKVLLLARTDKDSMPHSTKSRPREALPPEEIALIRQWILGP
jgi:mono/diheme cytochrome c family protein